MIPHPKQHFPYPCVQQDISIKVVQTQDSNTLPALKVVSGKMQPPGLQAWRFLGVSILLWWVKAHLHTSVPNRGCAIIASGTVLGFFLRQRNQVRRILGVCFALAEGIWVETFLKTRQERDMCTGFSPCRPEPRQVSVSSTGCYKMTLFLWNAFSKIEMKTNIPNLKHCLKVSPPPRLYNLLC